MDDDDDDARRRLLQTSRRHCPSGIMHLARARAATRSVITAARRLSTGSPLRDTEDSRRTRRDDATTIGATVPFEKRDCVRSHTFRGNVSSVTVRPRVLPVPRRAYSSRTSNPHAISDGRDGEISDR